MSRCAGSALGVRWECARGSALGVRRGALGTPSTPCAPGVKFSLYNSLGWNSEKLLRTVQNCSELFWLFWLFWLSELSELPGMPYLAHLACLACLACMACLLGMACVLCMSGMPCMPCCRNPSTRMFWDEIGSLGSNLRFRF